MISYLAGVLIPLLVAVVLFAYLVRFAAVALPVIILVVVVGLLIAGLRGRAAS